MENDRPMQSGGDRVSMATVPFWTGAVVSAAVADLEELARSPYAAHSALWILIDGNGRRAALVATDDLAADVCSRADILSWSGVHGLIHQDDLLSRSRCRFLAGLLRPALEESGLAVPPAPPVVLPESQAAEMTAFYRTALDPLVGLGLRPETALPA